MKIHLIENDDGTDNQDDNAIREVAKKYNKSYTRR